MDETRIESAGATPLQPELERIAKIASTADLQAETTPFADLADRASTEAERQLELRTRDRQRKLISRTARR